MDDPVIVAPEVAVIVHPIDPEAHPTYPPGWRWAVHVGGRPPADLDYCVQAGSAESEPEASAAGEMVGAAVAKGLRILGIPARYGYIRLGYDPLPSSADDRPLSVWYGSGE
jgi:hypothetical protein